MSSPFRKAVFAGVAGMALVSVGWAEAPLKVCADPDNLPFSSRQMSGFDNRIANLIGRELRRKVEFVWGRMGRGFVREYLNKGKCDVLLGVPKGMRGVLVTRPYYRSSYVFVTLPNIEVESLDDAALRKMKIGVQVLDDDYAPPAQALTRRGLASNIVGFDMEDPQQIFRTVVNKKVDVAIVWGPTAGYFARKFGRQIRMAPVAPEIDPPALPMAFDLGIGMRKSDAELLKRIDGAVAKLTPEIQRILRGYNVPTAPPREQVMAGVKRP